MALNALFRSALRALGNTGRIVRKQSLLKILVIAGCSAALFLLLGVIFFQGFRYLHLLGGVGLVVIQRLFALFFFALAIMLLFSSVVTTYTTMYRSDEVPSLLVRPVPLGELAIYKYVESALFSSWAFFFMILPFIGAYAIHEKLSPLFAIWTLAFSIPFVLLCSALGAIACMALVRWLPSGRALYALLGVAALAILVAAVRMAFAGKPVADETSLVLTRLIPGLRISSQPLLPSWWMAEGILALSRSEWTRGVLLWGMLTSTVLALALVIEKLGEWIFYDGWIKASPPPRRTVARAPGRSRFDAWFTRNPRDSRTLMLKDIRHFYRDAAQWSQVVVFFGLLAIYFFNLRQFRYHLLSAEWRNLIVFLNMFSVSAVICSLSARFVYPQMSLEGHSFWIVGMSPLSMERIVRAKFRLASCLLVPVSLALMLISANMLEVSSLLLLVSLAAAACISSGVTALAVGLGSVFLDLEQRNPAAIVSSFGGTLNLVLSMAFTFAILIPLAALFHYFALGMMGEESFRRWLLFVVIGMLALTFVVVRAPLAWGTRSLREREF